MLGQQLLRPSGRPIAILPRPTALQGGVAAVEAQQGIALANAGQADNAVLWLLVIALQLHHQGHRIQIHPCSRLGSIDREMVEIGLCAHGERDKSVTFLARKKDPDFAQNAVVKSAGRYVDPASGGAVPGENFVECLARMAGVLKSVQAALAALPSKHGPKPVALLYGHSMAGAALSILTGNGKTVDGESFLGFDGKYIMPNATPVRLL